MVEYADVLSICVGAPDMYDQNAYIDHIILDYMHTHLTGSKLSTIPKVIIPSPALQLSYDDIETLIKKKLAHQTEYFRNHYKFGSQERKEQVQADLLSSIKTRFPSEEKNILETLQEDIVLTDRGKEYYSEFVDKKIDKRIAREMLVGKDVKRSRKKFMSNKDNIKKHKNNLQKIYHADGSEKNHNISQIINIARDELQAE